MTGAGWEANRRLADLRRFAIAITVLNILGHTVLGFEQSWAVPLVSLDEMKRLIREEETPLPTARLRSLGARLRKSPCAGARIHRRWKGSYEGT
jgi:hypothetical protein